jgi:hypothetical protein
LQNGDTKVFVGRFFAAHGTHDSTVAYWVVVPINHDCPPSLAKAVSAHEVHSLRCPFEGLQTMNPSADAFRANPGHAKNACWIADFPKKMHSLKSAFP